MRKREVRECRREMTEKVADRKSQSKERMDGAQKEKKDNIE